MIVTLLPDRSRLDKMNFLAYLYIFVAGTATIALRKSEPEAVVNGPYEVDNRFL